MAMSNYSNPWIYGYGNQQYMNTPNQMANNQNTMNYANQIPQQNYGSFMTVLVQGEAGANAYPVASGNTVMLLDYDSGKFWIKSNVNGIPQRLRSFRFVEETQEQPQNQPNTAQTVSREEFGRLSDSVNVLSDNVKKLIDELGGN